MLQYIELFIVKALGWYYSTPLPVGVVALGVPAALLLLWQARSDELTRIPGILSVLCLIALAFHVVAPLREEVVVALLKASALVQPAPGVNPLPFPFESIMGALVAPASQRYLFEEILGVAIFLYLLSVIYHCYKDYREHGAGIRALLPSLSFFQTKNRRPARSFTNELGSGDFATTEQIAPWTKSSGDRYDTCLYATDLRGSNGAAFKHTKLIIPVEERNRHILCVAKTGSGKTTKMILPILYSDCLCPDRSTIVIDSKPEMWRKLAAMTRKYNPEKNIVLFNPLDVARTLSWNILGKIEDDTDCKLIANTIIMATDQPAAKSDSPFFRNNALAILNSIMMGLLHDPNEKLSMPRIHELVQGGMKPLCTWLEAHPHALRNTRTFIELARSGSQNADTIMSELSMRLSAWDLAAIRATTSTDELDLEELISKPTLFIVELRESEIEMLRPMANVIVVEILRFLTKRAESCPGAKLPRPVGLVIDEFASALGRLPDIHVKLNTLRSRNVSIVAAIQSISQVKAIYADDADSVLAGFNTKILMPTLDIQDAEWASKETGQMTVRFRTSSYGSNRKLTEFFSTKNDNIQEQVQQRAVLTPDEVGRPADNICTFFMPNTPVFQGHLVAYYKIPTMLHRIMEFDREDQELRMRVAPIKFDDKLPEPGPAAVTSGGVAANGALPAGITNTRGWTDDQIWKKYEECKKTLDWENTTGSAKKWWEAFETENKSRAALVLRLAEELTNRKATITEFFLAYVYSNTDNIQANLHYLDYTRLKKEEERKKREAAEQAKAAGGGAAPAAGAGAGATAVPPTVGATSPQMAA